MITDDSQNMAYAESPDGLQWSTPTLLGMFGHYPDLAAYPRAISPGNDPDALGKMFYVYFEQIPGSAQAAFVRRFTLSCQ
jgi:hypothetical protein